MEPIRLRALESSCLLHPSSAGVPWAEIVPWQKWCGSFPRSTRPVTRRRLTYSCTAVAKILNVSSPSGPKGTGQAGFAVGPKTTLWDPRNPPETIQVTAGYFCGLEGIVFEPGNPDRNSHAPGMQPTPIREMVCSTGGRPRMTRDFCRFKIKDRNRVPVVNLAPFPTNRSFRPSRPGRYLSLSQLTDPCFDI